MSTASPATDAHAPAARRRTLGAWFADTGWRHLVAIVVSVFALFPLLYVVSASLNPKGTLTGSNQLFSAIGIDSYVRILSDPQNPYGTWFLNTLLIAVVTGAVTVFIGACAAYAFSRMRFAGRRVGLVTIVVVQMFPQLLAVVAIFLLMSTLGDWFPAIGLNTHTGLILVYLGGALGVNTYLMYGFFNTIPKEIDEAARIDGAGHARIFFTIILRLVAPILAVVGLLSFIGTVNEYVIASVMLVDVDQQTLVVGLTKLVANPRYADWSAFSAGAVMAAIPVMILFLFLQKYIVGGLTAGATKG
ncbi:MULTISPECIES: sugar ABC transporter permease [Microbacterium]|jgi:arabinogalactan oligomer/maltooligosaccharide transport system permease protein|uniref:Sugar ABC transporter permease n=1 Tax=Microbacterium aurugineum TaxID=2851642 RepID=A0ABY4IYT7_9MICO|nr:MULTISPECIES: sugar ABC transporter permease [Microbacterium]PKQ34543.1 MAG: sugar ABC transporter permease [Actinobacteria bacterium HGW-Actinobacteria-11]MCK8468517.1 sugar ABC transporter permease [Microbacterium aurugineum]MCZ4302292.1 sugar ABC transporter permease [Microbacterium oxydans]TCJ23535.1 sugar ABC transporter permease [Microbacterium sp. PI-1]TFB15816.1 sugar ABC transporter permease [Microbacterium sp. 3H14]